jgi:hypothetical protein
MQFRVYGGLAYRRPSYSVGSMRVCDRRRCVEHVCAISWTTEVQYSSLIQVPRKLKISVEFASFHSRNRKISKNTQTFFGPPPPPEIQQGGVRGGLPGVRGWVESPRCSVEVKNDRNCSSYPPVCLCGTHRDRLVFVTSLACVCLYCRHCPCPGTRSIT